MMVFWEQGTLCRVSNETSSECDCHICHLMAVALVENITCGIRKSWMTRELVVYIAVSKGCLPYLPQMSL